MYPSNLLPGIDKKPNSYIVQPLSSANSFNSASDSHAEVEDAVEVDYKLGPRHVPEAIQGKNTDAGHQAPSTRESVTPNVQVPQPHTHLNTNFNPPSSMTITSQTSQTTISIAQPLSATGNTQRKWASVLDLRHLAATNPNLMHLFEKKAFARDGMIAQVSEQSSAGSPPRHAASDKGTAAGASMGVNFTESRSRSIPGGGANLDAGAQQGEPDTLGRGDQSIDAAVENLPSIVNVDLAGELERSSLGRSIVQPEDPEYEQQKLSAKSKGKARAEVQDEETEGDMGELMYPSDDEPPEMQSAPSRRRMTPLFFGEDDNASDISEEHAVLPPAIPQKRFRTESDSETVVVGDTVLPAPKRPKHRIKSESEEPIIISDSEPDVDESDLPSTSTSRKGKSSTEATKRKKEKRDEADKAELANWVRTLIDLHQRSNRTDLEDLNDQALEVLTKIHKKKHYYLKETIEDVGLETALLRVHRKSTIYNGDTRHMANASRDAFEQRFGARTIFTWNGNNITGFVQLSKLRGGKNWLKERRDR